LAKPKISFILTPKR